MNHDSLIQLALNCGFNDAAIVDTDSIVFNPEFRPFCEENLCGHYGANYSCPPDCGSCEAMEARVRQYQHALVVQSKWPITDYKDTAAIKLAKQTHNDGMLQIVDALKDNGTDRLMCGASCCTLCDRCAILDHQPCKQPDRRFSCLSAYCIYVKKLADSCNMEYSCADGSLAFFGLIAF